jgi:hypothetical protein
MDSSVVFIYKQSENHHTIGPTGHHVEPAYSGRTITESLGNVTARGEKIWGARLSTVCLNMYSIDEN